MAKGKLKILSKLEQKELYNIPIFDESQRNLYFTMNQWELAVMCGFHTTSSKIIYILQLGYFRAKHQFWPLNSLLKQVNDLAYIQKSFGFQISMDLTISKPTRLSQQRQILQLFKYQRFSHALQPILSFRFVIEE